jgi:hypothetical protein
VSIHRPRIPAANTHHRPQRSPRPNHSPSFLNAPHSIQQKSKAESSSHIISTVSTQHSASSMTYGLLALQYDTIGLGVRSSFVFSGDSSSTSLEVTVASPLYHHHRTYHLSILHLVFITVLANTVSLPHSDTVRPALPLSSSPTGFNWTSSQSP